MATEEGGMEDVDQALSQDSERKGIMGRLSDFKEKYVDFHRADEDSESWGEQQLAGGLSRRGFISLAGQTAVGGYAIVEALDGDGYAVDWSSGNAQNVGGPTGGAGGNETDGGDAYDGDNHLGTQGDVSDELYLQDDGTVIAIDYGHKEWRMFDPDNFPENAAYADLYADLEGERDLTSLAPPGLDTGIEVSQGELFNYSTSAYDDMADEAEWDLIFDSNPNYSGGE